MKKKLRILLLAGLAVLALFSLPMWLPGLLVNSAMAQGGANPANEGAVILLDGGWFTGQTQFEVTAVPQVLSWVPGRDSATWATETGFIYGGLVSGERVYVVEHRKIGVSSLRNLKLTESELYGANKDWAVFVTVLDSGNGHVISWQQMPEPPVKNPTDMSLYPIAVRGNRLYLMNYAMRNNLFAYNLSTGKFDEQVWSGCEKGYLLRAAYLESANSVAALCTDYNEKPVSWVTVTALSTGESSSVEIPALGDQDYETGNALLVTPRGEVYVIDTDAGVAVEINTVTMKLGEPIQYMAGLPEQESGLQQRFSDWLLGLGAQPAYAKRWMGLSAFSPDGRWLALDSGLGNMAANSSKPGVVILDAQTMQAAQLIEIDSMPSALAFSEAGQLLVFFEKNSSPAPLRGVMIDIESGVQSSLSLQIHGWLAGVIPLD